MGVSAHVYSEDQMKNQSAHSPVYLAYTCRRCNQSKRSTKGKDAAMGSHYTKDDKGCWVDPTSTFPLAKGTKVYEKSLNKAAEMKKGDKKGGNRGKKTGKGHGKGGKKSKTVKKGKKKT